MFTGIVEEVGTLRQIEPTGLVILAKFFRRFIVIKLTVTLPPSS